MLCRLFLQRSYLYRSPSHCSQVPRHQEQDRIRPDKKLGHLALLTIEQLQLMNQV